MANSSSTRDELKGALATQPRFDPSSVDMRRPTDVGTIGKLIEAQKSQIARALPKHMDADRLARIAFTTIRSTRGLATCTPESLLGGLMTCAQLGLEPGPLGHAYFVPFKNEVTFILGYRGMIELALRSGKIVSLIAREVYEQDEFDVAYGLEDALRHKPKVLGERGQVVAYYAVAKLVGGGHAFVVLSKADVEKIRKRSRAKDSGPWQTDYDAMAKKTCIRRLFTYLPSSVEMAQAIAQDEQVRTDIDLDTLDTPQPFTDGPQVLDGEVVPDGVDTSTGEVHEGVVVEDPPAPPAGWGDTEVAQVPS